MAVEVAAVPASVAVEAVADRVALVVEVAAEDPAVAERVVELEGQLIKAAALQSAGKYAEGLRLADAVVGGLWRWGFGRCGHHDSPK